jgi:hypothetical protein
MAHLAPAVQACVAQGHAKERIGEMMDAAPVNSGTARARVWLGIEEVLDLIDDLNGWGLVWTDSDDLRNRLQDLDFLPGDGARE